MLIKLTKPVTNAPMIVHKITIVVLLQLYIAWTRKENAIILWQLTRDGNRLFKHYIAHFSFQLLIAAVQLAQETDRS